MPRRRHPGAVALVFALLLWVGACGGDDDTAGPATAPGESTPSAPTPSGGVSGATSGSDDAPGTDASVPPASQPIEGQAAPSGEGSPGTTGAVVPSEGDVGAFGPWYLRSDAAASIILEVRSQTGAEPAAATVDRIRSLLQQVSGKSVSTTGGTVPGGARQWSPDAIRSEADRTGPAQSKDAAVLTLLFVHGGLADADQTVGVAVRSDVAAVFSDRVDEAAGPLGGAGRIESAVTTHEVGHLLGLVDLVLATGRADPDHPGHSSNRNSVMYYAVESTLVGDLLAGGPPVDFDAADLADLQVIGGR